MESWLEGMKELSTWEFGVLFGGGQFLLLWYIAVAFFTAGAFEPLRNPLEIVWCKGRWESTLWFVLFEMYARQAVVFNADGEVELKGAPQTAQERVVAEALHTPAHPKLLVADAHLRAKVELSCAPLVLRLMGKGYLLSQKPRLLLSIVRLLGLLVLTFFCALRVIALFTQDQALEAVICCGVLLASFVVHGLVRVPHRTLTGVRAVWYGRKLKASVYGEGSSWLDVRCYLASIVPSQMGFRPFASFAKELALYRKKMPSS